MASDSEVSTTELSQSKIRKDYLKLSKAKLSKKCKSLNLDTYGSKAVLVDLLMKAHAKKTQVKKPKHNKKRSINTTQTKKRSKSINISDMKQMKLIDRTHNKSRRSSMAVTTAKNRKDLLKMSKNAIIKQCKLQRINVNGLRNKNDMINKIVNLEQLFNEKKKRNMDKMNNTNAVKSKVRMRKKKKSGLNRSKSEDRGQAKKLLLASHVSAAQNEAALPPLRDDIKQTYFAEFAKCDITKCVSRRRLIMALVYYEDNYNEHGENDEMMTYFMDKYEYLLSDWHHILMAHLDCKSTQNYKNFNVLYDDVKKHHLLCDINECSHFMENNRNKEEVKTDDNDNDDIDLNSKFVMDLVGNIHIYLVHSFDIGFRMRNYSDFALKKKEEERKDNDCTYLYFDDEMESFEGYYALKRKELQQIKGVQRMKNNKYFTYVDNDGVDRTEDDEKQNDADKKSDIDNTLSSMKECNTKQIVRLLKDYFFDDIKSDILNHYKKKIISYFEENDWNGIELSNMTQISFVTELIIRCDNNKKLKPDLVKLFNLFDFTDFSGNSLKTHKVEYDIKSCNQQKMIYILQHCLFDKINNELLYQHRDEIVQYFNEHNIDGAKLSDMKRKEFCQCLIEHCNNNRKLNHSFILLYKEFFKTDLSQIVLPTNAATKKKKIVTGTAPHGTLEELVNMKRINKRRKRRGCVEPQFTSGNRFLYWQYYQNDKWFVHKKYSNLKEEILDNMVHSLNGSKWDEAYNKALYIKKSEIIKSIKCGMDKWTDLYGIAKDSPLKVSHLLSIIFYTDYMDLAFDFIKSFKKLSRNESNQELRDRHGEFVNWARCLRETVECHGCKMKDSKVDIFFYGISEEFVFKSFVGRFYAPTSATTQLSVSIIYAPQQNGMILELEKYRNGLELTYFNCSLISNFSNEDERLFVGGYRPLQFHSIRIVNKHENYVWFITALTIFNDFLNGKKLSTKEMKWIRSRHYMIVNQLCKHKASLNRNDNKLNNNYFRNRFPKYINDVFDSYCNKKKQIHINLKWLNQCYPGFKSYFSESMSNYKDRRKLTNRLQLKPEAISTKPKSINNNHNIDNNEKQRRRRRRHSVSGSMVQIDIICGKYVFDIFKNLVNPIHVVTELEGAVSYDIVQTLPNLLFVYKLNEKNNELRPMSLDNKIKKQFNSNVQFRNNINLMYIENPLYKYYVNKHFYIKHILEILKYFFDSQCLKLRSIDKKMSINNVNITEILKWKFNIYRNKIRFATEIYKYFNNKKEINININRIKLCRQASDCLLHEKCKRLCFFNILSSLFIKCEKIICYDLRVISAYYLQQLLVVLQNVNKNKYCKLKHIVLYQPLKIHATNQQFGKFKQKFVRNNWKITKKLYNNNNENLYLCFDKIVLRK